MSSMSHASRARPAVPSWPRRPSATSPSVLPRSAVPLALARAADAAPASATWRVQGTGLPLVRRRCTNCAAALSAATGKFRVNANGKLLDVWLLTRCVRCGRNSRLKVHHRVHVNAVAPDRLRGYMGNDPTLVAQALLDPLIARRNQYALEWTQAWELICPEAPPLSEGQLEVQVRFDVPAPIRPALLIAHGLHVSRREVERMIGDRLITSDVDLRRRTSSSFTFAVRPPHPRARATRSTDVRSR